jgi:hypothetical protein
MPQQDWIVINYTLPREPSRTRVAIWRKLKKIGSVNIQQSMWLLPDTSENYDQLCQIKDGIVQFGGEAFVMHARVDAPSQQVIIDRFNAARDEEYFELLGQCDDFFQEIDKETARQNFSFAEIEENEEELEKLKVWFEKSPPVISSAAPVASQRAKRWAAVQKRSNCSVKKSMYMIKPEYEAT